MVSSIPSDQTLRTTAITTSGTFVLGCNYWASHAGTNMWREWEPAVIDDDLRRLSTAGLQLLRVFPLWPDFQPIDGLYCGEKTLVEYRFGETPLPDDALGQAGISAVMMTRFGDFLEMLTQHGLSCQIGLLTGWMSGRLYVPPALRGRNMLTDPMAIQWELRFVHAFVSQFSTHPAILSWDLGNECNSLGSVTREQAYIWSATIANAIRAVDSTRPIASGMHGLSPEGAWTMQDQGEICDLLTTHPYPVFTPYCDQDPINTLRPILHAAAESRFYADIGHKPCLCQEIGTLGPMIASEAVAAEFTRASLFSLWANDCHGMLWWCAHDQGALTHAPYDWCACERELGLLRTDGTARPQLQEFTTFRQMLESLPFASLPIRRREAICILTRGQDWWGVAFSAFLLAKQAGFDLEFQYQDQPIREAELYLLPSLAGYTSLSLRRQQELMARIAAGATLYLSLDNALLSDFEAITGLRVHTRERRSGHDHIILDTLPDQPAIPTGGDFRLRVEPIHATVLARESDGNPAWSIANYGAGIVYCLTTPLEITLARTPGAFHSESALPSWRIYQEIAAKVLVTRAVRKTVPSLTITEHNLTSDSRVIIAMNVSPHPITDFLTPGTNWTFEQSLSGDVHANANNIVVTLPPNDAVIFTMYHGSEVGKP